MSCTGPFRQTHGDGFPAGGEQERVGEGQSPSCLLWWPVVLLTVLMSSDAKVVGGRACAPGLKRSGNGMRTQLSSPSHLSCHTLSRTDVATLATADSSSFTLARIFTSPILCIFSVSMNTLHFNFMSNLYLATLVLHSAYSSVLLHL